MNPLSLSAPLTDLLALAALTHEALAAKRGLQKEAVTMAVRKGPRIKLATLAAYARAAGYKLWVVQASNATARSCLCEGLPRVECNHCAGEMPQDVCWCHIGEPRVNELTYPPATAAENHELTAGQARALIERFGFAMVLMIESAPIMAVDGSKTRTEAL